MKQTFAPSLARAAKQLTDINDLPRGTPYGSKLQDAYKELTTDPSAQNTAAIQKLVERAHAEYARNPHPMLGRAIELVEAAMPGQRTDQTLAATLSDYTGVLERFVDQYQVPLAELQSANIPADSLANAIEQARQNYAAAIEGLGDAYSRHMSVNTVDLAVASRYHAALHAAKVLDEQYSLTFKSLETRLAMHQAEAANVRTVKPRAAEPSEKVSYHIVISGGNRRNTSLRIPEEYVAKHTIGDFLTDLRAKSQGANRKQASVIDDFFKQYDAGNAQVIIEDRAFNESDPLLRVFEGVETNTVQLYGRMPEEQSAAIAPEKRPSGQIVKKVNVRVASAGHLARPYNTLETIL